MLLTFFKQVRLGVKQCCITHSLSRRDWIEKSAYNDRSTHFLLVVWCTMGSFSNIEMESNVTHFLLIMGQDCWSQKEALLTNCSHQTIHVYQIYASSISLTHWYQYHKLLPSRIWWQWLACASLAIWSMTNIVFMWRHWSVTYPLMNICRYLSFHMKNTYLPVHLLPFKYSYADVEFDKNAYPIMWKFWENYENDIIPCPTIIFQNMSEKCQCQWVTFWMWPSLKCRFNTKVKIIHLCWNKQLMYGVIIYCISSLLS